MKWDILVVRGWKGVIYLAVALMELCSMQSRPNAQGVGGLASGELSWSHICDLRGLQFIVGCQPLMEIAKPRYKK